MNNFSKNFYKHISKEFSILLNSYRFLITSCFMLIFCLLETTGEVISLFIYLLFVTYL